MQEAHRDSEPELYLTLGGQVVPPEWLHCSTSMLHSATLEEEALKALYSVARFPSLSLRKPVSSSPSTFIFFTFFFPCIVRRALELIPACTGLKAGRQLGQAASPSQSPITHFRPGERSVGKKVGKNMLTKVKKLNIRS